MKVKMLTDIYGQAHWYDLEVQNVRVFKDRVKFYFTLSDGKRYTNEYNITDVIQLKVNGKMRVKNGMKLNYQEDKKMIIYVFLISVLITMLSLFIWMKFTKTETVSGMMIFIMLLVIFCSCLIL